MAITTTPRFGLKTFSSGTDAHALTRVEYNLLVTQIENNGVIGDQNMAALRPVAGLGHKLFWATDQARMYWDDGTAWQEVTNVGGGGAGTALNIGGAGAEGSSARAARADHVHPLILATISVPGAMSAADKTKLDNATSAATASRLVIRDGSGRAQFATPSSTNDAANKGYVDGLIGGTAAGSHTHAAADVVSGEFDPARLPTVTGGAKGAMPASDKVKLDAATNAATATALVSRDGSGRARFADPSAATDATNKQWVEAALLAQVHDDATSSVAGFMPAADKAKLDQAASAATAGKLVIRDGSGRAKVATPAASDDIATKGYADSVVTGKRSDAPPFAHMGMTAGSIIVDSTTPKKTQMDAAQVLHGFTFDNANDALTCVTSGWYEVICKGLMNVALTNGDGVYYAEAYVNSSPSGARVGMSFIGYLDYGDLGTQDNLSASCSVLKYINAGEKIQLFQWSAPRGDTYTNGTNGYDGAYIEVRWYSAA